jgi:hypothetical protein
VIYKFKEIDGKIGLVNVDDGLTIQVYESLTFVVEKNQHGSGIEYTVHKYGEHDVMKDYLESMKGKLVASGLSDWAAGLFLLKEQPGRPWSIEDLNWSIECTGGIKKIIDKIDALDVEFSTK